MMDHEMREILARELFVLNRPQAWKSAATRREYWYLDLDEGLRHRWRLRATELIDSLAQSHLLIAQTVYDSSGFDADAKAFTEHARFVGDTVTNVLGDAS